MYYAVRTFPFRQSVKLTEEGVGDELWHLIPWAARLWQLRQLAVQHPLKLQENKKMLSVQGVQKKSDKGISEQLLENKNPTKDALSTYETNCKNVKLKCKCSRWKM